MWKKAKKYIGGLLASAGLVAMAALPASAEMTSLINFQTLATDITPLITTAVTVAAGIGALILAAKACWGFFKKFIRG